MNMKRILESGDIIDFFSYGPAEIKQYCYFASFEHFWPGEKVGIRILSSSNEPERN